MSTSVTASQIAAVALVALSIGYAFGARSVTSRLHAEQSKSKPTSQDEQRKPTNDVKDGEESDGDEGEVADGDLSSVKAGLLEPCKLVLVVRTDLGMSPGKIAAQCSFFDIGSTLAKIALKANSEDQLLELEGVAKSLNLCARSILDAGRTQIAAGSRTVLGIGPAPVELVNKVTGKLRLL
ncbi:hypothetical protein NLI96_g8473 [Meripilus lineatus]|uniref:peptidyl-tRNA hydrolase n=1 Tax=Meripilus lineatus TaxID=2056292 RepID=A0AAD5YBZ0_9APHY|nr:hypothetical protein NLI96_g8473 [Physisporinus lineatus]